ncbi:hypothetical protein GCM10011331_23770 [Flavimobilis marinus]|nr:hypothetical protein GCM10011331_23770 [Flavimobilis marinus]
MRDETLAGGEHHFFVEPQLIFEERRDDELDRAALRTVDVNGIDRLLIRAQVLSQGIGKGVNAFKLTRLSRSQHAAHEALLADLHVGSFAADRQTS